MADASPTDKLNTSPQHLPAHVVRELAVVASCDPRTITRAWQGLPIRGVAGERARRALAERGLLPRQQEAA